MTIESVLALVGIAASLLTAARTFFVVEERQKTDREKLAKVERSIDEFNGPARAAHVELVGRVASLESTTQNLATKESVTHLMDRMEQAFREVKALINNLDHDVKKEK